MTEWIELFALIIGVINTVVIPWAIWVTTKVFHLEKELALNIQADKDRNKKLDEILQKITDLHNDLANFKLGLAEEGIKIKK